MKRTQKKRKHVINRDIKAEEVRLVSEDKSVVGVMPISQALKMAENAELDLVEMSDGNPPVCKIMDYGKFCYEQDKRTKIAKKKQKIVHLKEIKLRPNIGEHDLEVKLNHARKFIESGDKVKFSLRFKGREASHQEIAFDLFKRVIETMADIAKPEVEPKYEGRQVIMVIVGLE